MSDIRQNMRLVAGGRVEQGGWISMGTRNEFRKNRNDVNLVLINLMSTPKPSTTGGQ